MLLYFKIQIKENIVEFYLYFSILKILFTNFKTKTHNIKLKNVLNRLKWN